MTAPVGPFLTELDPRLKVRGSRDPLGVQAVWATIGRQLVGNLTLTSNDVAGFRTLLIGYGLPADDASTPERLRLFLRWEQAAAACRVAARDASAPIGALRVRRQLARGDTVMISEEPQHQILRDQRATGLWILYHRAARTSGLATNSRRLTPTGQALVDAWLSALRHDATSLMSVVRAKKRRPLGIVDPNGATTEALAVSTLLVRGTAHDRAELRRHLVDGEITDVHDDKHPHLLAGGRQRRLAAILSRRTPDLTLVETIREARTVAMAPAETADDGLAACLECALIAESVLAPAAALFALLLHSGHGATPADLARRVATAWPGVAATVRAGELRRDVGPVLRLGIGHQRTTQWLAVADAMAAGHWTGAIETLLALHASTMHYRGSAPWLQENPRGALAIRLREDGEPLPTEDELRARPANPYYLTPLMTLQRDLQEATS